MKTTSTQEGNGWRLIQVESEEYRFIIEETLLVQTDPLGKVLFEKWVKTAIYTAMKPEAVHRIIAVQGKAQAEAIEAARRAALSTPCEECGGRGKDADNKACWKCGGKS